METAKKYFEIHKKCSKNKNIALQSIFVFIIEAILQIIKETKSINVTKKCSKVATKMFNLNFFE